MPFPNSRWRCLRHETLMKASVHVDEANETQYHAWCPGCYDDIDKMRLELKMYHDMDEVLRKLQSVVHEVLK
jgi:hypothetical protein